MKKEICWDEKEERDQERTRLKAIAREQFSSSLSEDLEEAEERREMWQDRSEVWRDVSETLHDVSETLWETEYHSDTDQSCMHFDPEERGCVTPTRRLSERNALSTPRICRKRHCSSSSRHSSVRKIQKLFPHITDSEDSVTVARSKEDVLNSNYETAGEGQRLSGGGGCFSGSGEWQMFKSSTDSDRLEHVSSPPQPDNDEFCIPDILTTPLPLLSDSYDESLSVIVRRRSVKSGREKTEEEGDGDEGEGKCGAVGGLRKGVEGEGEAEDGVKGEKQDYVKCEEGEGVKGKEGDVVQSEEGEGVKCEDVKSEEGEDVKSEEGEEVKSEEGEGVKGEKREDVKSEEGEGVQSKKGEGEGVKGEGFRCPNHVTAPLVIHNTNVSYITYNQCCHASSPSDIKLSPSHSTQYHYCHTAQPCSARVHPSPSPCHPSCCHRLHPSCCHPLHPSHSHPFHPTQAHKEHPYKPNQPTKYYPSDLFDNLLPH